MPCLWLTHNNSQLFINVGIIDALTQKLSWNSMGANIPPPRMFTSLVDTGAQRTMISTNVVTTLGLKPQGRQQIIFYLPEPIYGAELTASLGFDVLLGMDIISKGSLKIEGNGHFSFSF